MKYPPLQFIIGILQVFQPDWTLLCLDKEDGDRDFHLETSMINTSVNLFSFMYADDIASANFVMPSQEETALVICPNFVENLVYQEAMFRKNIIWFVPDDQIQDYHSQQIQNLRLDSLFFSYSALASVTITIYELYKVKKGPTIKQDFGFWYQNKSNLVIPEPGMWERRTNLQGVELIDTVLEWKPFLILDPIGGIANATGIAIDLMIELQKFLNFTVKRRTPDDGEWGIIQDVNGTVTATGLFGDLINGDADMCSCGLYMTKERQTHGDMIDFMSDITTLIMPNNLLKTGPNLDTLAYINIFPVTIWILIIASCVLTFLTFSYAKHLLLNNDAETSRKLLMENLQGSFLVLLQLDVMIPSEKLVLKVLFLTGSLASYVIYVTYCSDLTALMTHRPPPVPLQNFQDVLDAGYNFRVVKGSAIERWLAEADPNSATKKLHQKIVEDPKLYFDGFTQAQDELQKSTGSVTFDSYLGYANSDWATALMKFEDRVPVHAGWSFQYNSELSGLFGHHLSKMLEAGVTARAYQEWVKRSQPDDMEDRIFVEEAEPLGYANLFFPYMILGCGVALSLLCLAIESCNRRVRNI